MGVDTRKPPLPAPTESTTLQTSGDDVAGTDLATDLSRRTDRSSYSIPEDGSPVTITTKKRRDSKHKDQDSSLARTGHPSQTSLLIEYFEGGKGPNVHSRPSVRVKVTPSSARRSKDSKDHIQITEGGGRTPSYTRRISLGPEGETLVTANEEISVSSLVTGSDNANLGSRRHPVEIEVMHKDQGSDLSGTSSKDHQNMQYNMSDISSMPPDSLLEGNHTNRDLTGAAVAAGAAVATAAMLKAPSRRRSRSLSRESIARNVVEKLGNKPRGASGTKHKHGSSSRSVSKDQVTEAIPAQKRRSSKTHQAEEVPSGAESSLLGMSQVSDRRKSGDQFSFRSGTSKSSLNNPRLLETVEDAIRRLILPELTALKHEQLNQQNRSRAVNHRRDSLESGSSVSRDDLTRKSSKRTGESTVRGKPKVVLNRDDRNAGTILSGDSGKKKHRRHEDSADSPSERSFDRGMSEETVVRADGRSSRKGSGHKLRDAAAGALIGGVLTHAALKHHDSKSSIERRERRKKRSNSHSHSRSESRAESTEDIFIKHEVPQMPMQSEINSDLTRASILTERTSTPTSDRRLAGIQQVVRGSPKALPSSVPATPTKSARELRQSLDTDHTFDSHDDGSVHSSESNRRFEEARDSNPLGNAAVASALAGAGAFVAQHELNRYEANEEHHYSHGRGLSPIQSVASFQEEDVPPNRQSFRQTHSSGSLSSMEKNRTFTKTKSINSLSTTASIDLARASRPRGIILESEKEILDQHNQSYADDHHEGGRPRDVDIEAWYDQQHEENESYRGGEDCEGDSMVDIKHLTNYTDDSMDAPYLDQVTAAQQIRGVGANPEYIDTSFAVESAVASLHDSSILGGHSTQSGPSKLSEISYLDSPNEDHGSDVEYANGGQRGFETKDRGSPLKQEHTDGRIHVHSVTTQSYDQDYAANSPRQSIARSHEEREEPVVMTASGVPQAGSPLPEIGVYADSDKSDISTNPSIIRGPLGGVPLDNRTHWPFQATPPLSKGDILARSNNNSTHGSLKAAAANMLAAAAGASAGAGAVVAGAEQGRKVTDSYDHDHPRDLQDHLVGDDENFQQGLQQNMDTQHDLYTSGQTVPTPIFAKDEGYISARSPMGYVPKGMGLFDDDGMGSVNNEMDTEDPFVVGGDRVKQLGGNLHGMGAPLYDSATGKGIDRIQSKDIVALMDHLTVRDAQRNARDTEILVTLVRSAAEMRNSFEDMKKFIAVQDDMLVTVGNKQHDQTARKIIGGPRPQLLGTPRTPRKISAEEDMMDDLPEKRRNVFRRALKGLGGRSSNDLAKIEDMLNQLLNEVADLKAVQEPPTNPTKYRGNGFSSYENMRDVAQDGYEPEGRAGTSSTDNLSDFHSNPPAHQMSGGRAIEGRRASQNRVSTVLEADEEPDTYLEAHEQNILDNQFEHNEQLLTPTREVPRTGSAPLGTPRRSTMPQGTQSNENTPRTEKSRNHKSTSSSFFPKISRWSKTTTSSVVDNFRNSNRTERPFSGVSHSGSELNYDDDHHYDPHGDDRLRSNTSLEHERAPSPLIPSQVSDKPAYQAHRDSLNLQHPQPRAGPTARYQNHLESQAQNLGSPVSPSSDQFGSNPILSRFAPGGGNRFSGGTGNLSPISDVGNSELSAAPKTVGPPRPPKIRDDGPLVPSVTSKKPTFAERSAPATEEEMYRSLSGGYDLATGSPRSLSGQVLQRKPTGPRPITTSGNYSPDKLTNLKKTRYRGSPNALEYSSEDATF